MSFPFFSFGRCRPPADTRPLSETLSWDVRTKHVTFDSIPTLEHIRGLAVYGPGASLFTLGANNTVQQYDLNAPAVMVINVQHPANLLPPSPPVSIEEQDKAAAASASTSVSASNSESEISVRMEGAVSESDEDRMSPLARIMHAHELDSDQDLIRTASPASSQSQLSSVSSASSQTPGRRLHGSVQSRGLTDVTYISAGSSVQSSAGAIDGYSLSSLSSVSMNSAHNRSRRRPSRLRNEIPRSPEDSKVQDLFKFTRSRLSDVPYRRPPMPDASRLTNDDLRRQMLSTIFGWNKDIRDLVRDEMARHPVGSPNRILLSKWLGDMDADVLTASSQNMTSSDWMLLALSGIGGPQASQHKLGHAYVQRLLETGDVHAATTIMLGMGDHNDAIEIYVSHKRYMEALILPQRRHRDLRLAQALHGGPDPVRAWPSPPCGSARPRSSRSGASGPSSTASGSLPSDGERPFRPPFSSPPQLTTPPSFACTGKESTEPWTSPSAAQVNFQSITATIPEVLSPPLSPPGLQRGPQRSIAKTSALRLITSFGDQGAKAKYFQGQDGGGQTPIAAGVTPIAESAISPGPSGEITAFLLKPTRGSSFNTPNSARSNNAPGSFGRRRLPSIGEVTDGPNRDLLKATGLPTPPVDKLEHGAAAPVAATVTGATSARGKSRGHSPKVSFDNAALAGTIGRASSAQPP